MKFRVKVQIGKRLKFRNGTEIFYCEQCGMIFSNSHLLVYLLVKPTTWNTIAGSTYTANPKGMNGKRVATMFYLSFGGGKMFQTRTSRQTRLLTIRSSKLGCSNFQTRWHSYLHQFDCVPFYNFVAKTRVGRSRRSIQITIFHSFRINTSPRYLFKI